MVEAAQMQYRNVCKTGSGSSNTAGFDQKVGFAPCHSGWEVYDSLLHFDPLYTLHLQLMAAAQQGAQGGKHIWGQAKASKCRGKPNDL